MVVTNASFPPQSLYGDAQISTLQLGIAANSNAGAEPEIWQQTSGFIFEHAANQPPLQSC
jgi:hypothetical protein